MKFNFIQLFADGGDSGVGVDASTTGEVDEVANSNTLKLKEKRLKANPLADVKYGIQDEEPTDTDTEEVEEPIAEEPTKKSFDELLEDEDYKKAHDDKVQKAIQKRFKSAKANEDALKKWDGVKAIMSQYYGVDVEDTDAIIDAIKGDDNYFKKAAIKNGSSTEQERRQFELEQENQRVKQELEAKREEEQKAQLFAKWDREIPEVKEVFPDFDMETELANPTFARLTEVLSLRDAYETVHRKEITAGLIQKAQSVAASQIAQNVAANQSRPVENGISTKATPVVKLSPKDLTPEDRKEIKRRVRLGEKIRFG